TLGYSDKEISNLTFLDVIHEDDRQHCRQVFQSLKDGKENVDIEVSIVGKSGRKIIVEGKINTKFKDGKPFATRGIFRDITERKRAEKTLDTIIQVTSSKVGEEFLETLVSTLATSLRVKYVFITEAKSGDKFAGKTVVYWKRGKIEKNFEYDYSGTPCGRVMEAGIAFYPVDADKKFPDDLMLKKEGIKSYMAIAFSDSSGQLKGHMGVMDTKPIERSSLAESMLKAFTARAGIELERKHTEEALRENQERLTGFMESATDMFTLFDQNLNLVEVNKAACKILKRKKKDLIGKNILELIPGIKDSGRYEKYLKVLETGKPFFADDFLSHPQLGNRFLSLKAFKVGEGLGFIITDITRLKETVNALKESKERIHSIVDNVVDAIITIDENGIIESVNKATRKLFGYKRSELIGNNVKTLMPEKYKKKHESSIKSYFSGKETRVIGKIIELSGRKKNGSFFPIDLAINEMWIDDKRMFTGIIRDITERKDAQNQIESKNEKLNRLIEELRSIDKLKSNFVSTVSHELRTPLTSIKASIGLVLAESVGEIDKEAKQFLKICYSNTDRLIRLINDLLDLSKLEEKTIELSKREFDMSGLVEEVIWGLNSVADYHSVSVVNEVKENITINADRDRIAQVLNNLMSNGIKFSGDGNIINVKSHVKNGLVEITVADRGKPIPENIKEKIFKRFFQADGTSSRKVGGTGLGLAISKSIIEQHGGEIWVESGKNKGNSFKFTLPANI
ncbi:PAS domain S-box protein, partial [candidate division KSB1 bacterium]|nr:PAS domain S-box protein [candidate division KSB1 bacterium]